MPRCMLEAVWCMQERWQGDGVWTGQRCDWDAGLVGGVWDDSHIDGAAVNRFIHTIYTLRNGQLYRRAGEQEGGKAGGVVEGFPKSIRQRKALYWQASVPRIDGHLKVAWGGM